jgi:hypothetical protein
MLLKSSLPLKSADFNEATSCFKHFVKTKDAIM